MNYLRSGQWKLHQKNLEFLPEEIAFVVSAVQPSLPSTLYLTSKLSKRLDVARNTIVSEMTSHLFTQFLPLLSNRFVPIRATPLVNVTEATSKSRLHCLAFDCPVALWSFIPIVRKTK